MSKKLRLPPAPSIKPETSNVYVKWNGDCHKVGRALDVEQRGKALNTGSFNDYKTIHTRTVPYKAASSVETGAHKILWDTPGLRNTREMYRGGTHKQMIDAVETSYDNYRRRNNVGEKKRP